MAAQDDHESEREATARLRLDKWLWAARFFKTRTLAAAAVAGGKVHVNDQRAKPSHLVRVGEKLRIQRGPYECVMEIKALSRQRGPAKEAALLYEETAASRQRREELIEQHRLQRSADPQPTARPTKKDRRRIVRFTYRDT